MGCAVHRSLSLAIESSAERNPYMFKHPARSDYSCSSALYPALPVLPLNQYTVLQDTVEVLQDTADGECGNGLGGKDGKVMGVEASMRTTDVCAEAKAAAEEQPPYL